MKKKTQDRAASSAVAAVQDRAAPTSASHSAATESTFAMDGFGERRRIHRSMSLFRAMSGDALLRDQFVTDPARILHEFIDQSAPVDDDADATNQLIYALFSNAVTRNWIAHVGARSQSLDGFAKSLAEAVARSGDSVSTLALLRLASVAAPGLGERLGAIRSIAVGLGGVIATGTEMSSPGTEMSSPGTERSLGGAVFAGTEMSSPGTEMSSPGTERSLGGVFEGTEMSSPGTEVSSPGTEVSPGSVFAGTEQSSPGTWISPGPGTEISPGSVFAGTEQSSPGTWISPGPGTDVSPVGGFGGISVILNSLTHYAVELRRAGVLHVSGLERHR